MNIAVRPTAAVLRHHAGLEHDPVFLEELCLSVLRQDCAADLFEWVVVDNASTRAETRAVLDRWAAADARLRVHRADEISGSSAAFVRASSVRAAATSLRSITTTC